MRRAGNHAGALPLSPSSLDASLDSLEGSAHAAFLALTDAATAQGLAFTVRSTRRTCAQQNGLYAIGRAPGDTRAVVTHARGCVSWHVLGRAIDVTMTSGTYDDFGALAKSLGWKWGGDFKYTDANGFVHAFPDVGHVEWHPGLTIEDVCPNPDACVDSDVDTTLPGGSTPGQESPVAGLVKPIFFLLGSAVLLGVAVTRGRA